MHELLLNIAFLPIETHFFRMGANYFYHQDKLLQVLINEEQEHTILKDTE